MWRHVTLECVARLEEDAGVVRLARDLIGGQVDDAAAAAALDRLGLDWRREDAPLLLLSQALGHIVTCFADMQALCGDGLDLPAVRRFFMGVMRWPPQVVRRARLSDLRDAFDGYCACRGLAPVRDGISAGFLQDMLRRFPDAATD